MIYNMYVREYSSIYSKYTYVYLFTVEAEYKKKLFKNRPLDHKISSSSSKLFYYKMSL